MNCFTPPHLRAILLRRRITGTNPIFAGLRSLCGIEAAGHLKVAGSRYPLAELSRPLANHSRQPRGFKPSCRRLARCAPKQKLGDHFAGRDRVPKLYILIGARIRERQPALLSSGMLEPHVDHPTRLPVHSFLAVSVGFSVRARKRRAQVTPESPPTTKH